MKPRAISRFATFAQAISSTRPTIDISGSSPSHALEFGKSARLNKVAPGTAYVTISDGGKVLLASKDHQLAADQQYVLVVYGKHDAVKVDLTPVAFADGKLQRTDFTGPPRTICQAATLETLPSWGSAGQILFAQIAQKEPGLFVVDAAVGQPRRVV